MGGREFSAPNFRTIAVGADEIPGENPELSAQFQQDHKLKHGPGVNWVGRFPAVLNMAHRAWSCGIMGEPNEELTVVGDGKRVGCQSE
jgi:hypothetical protein